jgi:hypothetical protein
MLRTDGQIANPGMAMDENIDRYAFARKWTMNLANLVKHLAYYS